MRPPDPPISPTRPLQERSDHGMTVIEAWSYIAGPVMMGVSLAIWLFW